MSSRCPVERAFLSTSSIYIFIIAIMICIIPVYEILKLSIERENRLAL